MNHRIAPSATAYLASVHADPSRSMVRTQTDSPVGQHIRLVMPARAATGFPTRASAHSKQQGVPNTPCVKCMPLTPSWADTLIDEDTLATLDETIRQIRRNRWTEIRFTHPVIFGFARIPDTQRHLFTPNLTEIAVLNQSLVLTTSDVRSGLTVESITLDHQLLRQLLADHKAGATVYLGNPPEHVQSQHELGVPCPTRERTDGERHPLRPANRQTGA